MKIMWSQKDSCQYWHKKWKGLTLVKLFKLFQLLFASLRPRIKLFSSALYLGRNKEFFICVVYDKSAEYNTIIRKYN